MIDVFLSYNDDGKKRSGLPDSCLNSGSKKHHSLRLWRDLQRAVHVPARLVRRHAAARELRSYGGEEQKTVIRRSFPSVSDRWSLFRALSWRWVALPDNLVAGRARMHF